MFDSNLNWVQVTVGRPEEVARVHAAIRDYLARDRLREAIDDVIVIPFADRRADHGVEAVQSVLEQEFGSPDWVRVEVGRGNLRWSYRDA